MTTPEATQLIGVIREEVEAAADALLSAAEHALKAVGRARGGQLEALNDVEGMLCAILEACAFQDLTGQRLSQLEVAIGAVKIDRTADPNSLLNGPALPGQGLTQAVADGLMQPARSQSRSD